MYFVDCCVVADSDRRVIVKILKLNKSHRRCPDPSLAKSAKSLGATWYLRWVGRPDSELYSSSDVGARWPTRPFPSGFHRHVDAQMVGCPQLS